MKKFFLAITLALTSVAALANSGMSAFSRKDYNEAYRIWSRSPDTAESQYGLGLLHYEGLGGPKNTERGLSLLRSSSEKGHRPATEYLAVVFEKTGDARSALRFLERLQAQERTLKTQERIVEAQKKLVKGAVTSSADYCSAVNELVKLGGVPDNEVPELCALGGLASPVSPENARQWLSKSFQKKPSIESLEILAQDFLDPSKSSFNPNLIEEAVWTLDPDLTNRAIRAILIEKGKINQEICRSLPFGNADQRLQFSAYCSLVVISGLNKNPLVSAKEYISGIQGRTFARVSDRVPRGLKLLSLQPEVFDSPEGLYLRIEAFRIQGDWRRSFELIRKNLRTLSQSKSPQNEQELRYILDRANLSSKNWDDSFTQANAKDLSELIDALPGDIELKKYTCVVLPPYLLERFTNPQDYMGDTAKALSKNLDSICSNSGLKRPAPELRPPPPAQSASVSASARSTPEQSGKGGQPSGNASDRTTTTDFDKSIFDCNQGNHTGCGPAAQALLSNNPPPMYQSLTREQRQEVAEKLLLLGAKSDDPASLATLWDIYEYGLDSSKRPTAQKFLATLLSKGHPSGLLRQEIQSLPREAVSGLLGNLFQRERYAATCERIKKFRDGTSLSAYDKDRANTIYNGPMCLSVRLGSTN